MLKTSFGDTSKAIQEDQGGDLMSNEFKNYCDKERDWCLDTLCVNRPQQNGTAEKGDQIIGERSTAMPKANCQCNSG